MKKILTRLFIIGSMSLLYITVFIAVVIPLLRVPSDPFAPWPDFSWTDWIVYILYIPAMDTAEVLSNYLPFMAGPGEPGVWAVVTLFGLIWGLFFYLLGKGLTERIRKKESNKIQQVTSQ